MAYFDDKQTRLINAWHSLALKSEDAYMAFMAEWIAFNAICYNLYKKKAIIDRANIDRGKSKLDKIHAKFTPTAEVNAQTAKLLGTKDKWSVDLLLPERLFISVSNNYTEDIIFNEFVKENQTTYKIPATLFEDLKNSLVKGDRYFVINMAKEESYNNKKDIETIVSGPKFRTG